MGDLGRRGWGDIGGTNSVEQNQYNSKEHYQNSSTTYQNSDVAQYHSTEKTSLMKMSQPK